MEAFTVPDFGVSQTTGPWMGLSRKLQQKQAQRRLSTANLENAPSDPKNMPTPNTAPTGFHPTNHDHGIFLEPAHWNPRPRAEDWMVCSPERPSAVRHFPPDLASQAHRRRPSDGPGDGSRKSMINKHTTAMLFAGGTGRPWSSLPGPLVRPLIDPHVCHKGTRLTQNRL